MTGIGAVILAAGSSSRMGSPKQILPFRGRSLLRHAALAALGAGCAPVLVVTGAYAELSRRELEGLDVQDVLNPRWETGMASSISAGIESLLGAKPDAAAAVLMLCDQPHVTAGIISGLMAAHRVTGSPIVASTYGGSFGAPALFSRPLFAELAGLEGGAGAKQVIERYASEACFLPFPGGEVDVDTRDDFSRLIAADPGDPPMNARSAGYWTTTTLMALAFLAGGAAYLSRRRHGRAGAGEDRCSRDREGGGVKPNAAAVGARLRPVGVIRSALKARDEAPKQGSEGAPDAWLEVRPRVAEGLKGLAVGDDIIVITWFHQADRNVLQVHPRSDPRNPLTGVFATRSPDRPNPLGLHPVTVRAIEGNRLRVGPLEAIDGTPVVDIKPVL